MAKIVRDTEYKDLIQARRFRSVQEIIVTTIRCYKGVGKVKFDALGMYELSTELSMGERTKEELVDRIKEFAMKGVKDGVS